jgi:hypothetical protein
MKGGPADPTAERKMEYYLKNGNKFLREYIFNCKYIRIY